MELLHSVLGMFTLTHTRKPMYFQHILHFQKSTLHLPWRVGFPFLFHLYQKTGTRKRATILVANFSLYCIRYCTEETHLRHTSWLKQQGEFYERTPYSQLEIEKKKNKQTKKAPNFERHEITVTKVISAKSLVSSLSISSANNKRN